MTEWWRDSLTPLQRRLIAGTLGLILAVGLVTIGIAIGGGSGDEASSSTTTLPGTTSSSSTTSTSTPTTTTTPKGDAAANAGDDQLVAARSTVTLDASDSADPDEDELSYEWTQTFGPDLPDDVDLTQPIVNFEASSLPSTYIFELTVSDGTVSEPDEVIIHVLEDPTAAVFVDSSTGSDSNPGTMEQPLASLGAGVSKANDMGRDIYLMDSGSAYDFGQQTEVFNDVSIHGGYQPGWIRGNDQTPTTTNFGVLFYVETARTTLTGLEVSGTGESLGGTLGISGRDDLPSDALLHNLTVSLEGGSESEAEFIGTLQASGLETLVLDGVTVTGGSGRSGSDGFSVSEQASNGGSGLRADGRDPGGARDGGGPGGRGGNVVASAGDDGRAGLAHRFDSTDFLPGAQGAKGGSGGSGGRNGNDGADGKGGLGGEGGAGGVLTAETVFAGEQGGPGWPGYSGSGGGGGGGGAGKVGLVGGGGGGGGGLGQGGGVVRAGGIRSTGGGPGQGSHGMVVLFVADLTIRNSEISGGFGGPGGQGGAGEDGGNGGDGASGARGACSFLGCGAGQAGNGGSGGGGGGGGQGGQGGGGTGGSAFGLAVFDSTVTIVSSRISGGVGGNPGQGGMGGLNGDPGRSGTGGDGGGTSNDPEEDPRGPNGEPATGGWAYAIWDASEEPGSTITLDDVELNPGTPGDGGVSGQANWS